MVKKSEVREGAISVAMSELAALMAKEAAGMAHNAQRWDSDNNGHFWTGEVKRSRGKFADLANRIFGDAAHVMMSVYDHNVTIYLDLLIEGEKYDHA